MMAQQHRVSHSTSCPGSHASCRLDMAAFVYSKTLPHFKLVKSYLHQHYIFEQVVSEVHSLYQSTPDNNNMINPETTGQWKSEKNSWKWTWQGWVNIELRNLQLNFSKWKITAWVKEKTLLLLFFKLNKGWVFFFCCRTAVRHFSFGEQPAPWISRPEGSHNKVSVFSSILLSKMMQELPESLSSYGWRWSISAIDIFLIHKTLL